MIWKIKTYKGEQTWYSQDVIRKIIKYAEKYLSKIHCRGIKEIIKGKR